MQLLAKVGPLILNRIAMQIKRISMQKLINCFQNMIQEQEGKLFSSPTLSIKLRKLAYNHNSNSRSLLCHKELKQQIWDQQILELGSPLHFLLEEMGNRLERINLSSRLLIQRDRESQLLLHQISLAKL